MSGVRQSTIKKRDKGLKMSLSRLTVPKKLYLGIILVALLMSCHKKNDDADYETLVIVNGNKLTKDDVIEKIPIGLREEDSIMLFNVIIDNWIKTEVLLDLAKKNIPEYNQIEKKVDDYRNRLIVQEYIDRLKPMNEVRIEESVINNYYFQNHEEMILSTPLVKGIYIKYPTDSPELLEIKELLGSMEEESIDTLEQKWLDNALAYQLFTDKWVEWESIADRIPYRFPEGDEFLKRNKFSANGHDSANDYALEADRIFETEHNGVVHLLRIEDFLPTGTEMPYEYAKEKIQIIIQKNEIEKIERDFIASLVEEAIKNGNIVPIAYDPLHHEMTTKIDNK